MTRPTLVDHLLGNPLSLIAVTGLMLFLGYQWLAEGASFVPALIALFGVSVSGAASNKIQEYNRWKSEWDAMGGAMPGGITIPPAMRSVMGVIGLIGGGVLAVDAASDPSMAIPVLGYWLAVLFTVCWFGAKLLKRSSGKPKAAKFEFIDVAVVVPVPKQSARLEQAYAALPAHCMRLFR